MNSAFEKIVDQLRVQEAEFQGEVQTLKEKLARLTKQLAQVQTAIHSLSGKSAVPAPSSAKPTAKPSLSIDEIRQIIQDARGRSRNITDEQLFKYVETELVSKGGKRHGLKANFQKVLSELAKQAELQVAGTNASPV